MKKLIIASMRQSGGKTSVIVGLAQTIGKPFGYIKPFGDRMVYLKKRLWDYDAALITNIFGLEKSPEEMSIGFEHPKLRFMYDEEGTREKLHEMATSVGGAKDLLFVEGGKNLTYGTSVNLDALSVTKYLDGELVIVVSGDESTVMDNITYLKRHVDMSGIDFKGVIINKVPDIQDFQDTYLPDIIEMGIDVLGIIPNRPELTHLSVNYLANRLFAKVIAGEAGLNRKVKNIFVGAMSAHAALRNPLFRKENKLIITSGDRSDMILAALKSDTSCVILTNNILPPSNIISKASEKNIPLLLVPQDTYNIAMQINRMEGLLTKGDSDKIEMLGDLIRKHVNIY